MIKYMNKIDASIIIRTKNEEQWIDHCLKSVFNQKDVSFEVIIVDNNSKDGSKNSGESAEKFLFLTYFWVSIVTTEGPVFSMALLMKELFAS